MPIFVYYLISALTGVIVGVLINPKRPRGPYGAMFHIVYLPIAGWLTISILGAVFLAWWHIFLLLLTGYIVMKLTQLFFRGKGI